MSFGRKVGEADVWLIKIGVIPKVFKVKVDSADNNVTAKTNSIITDFIFSQLEKKISLNVTGSIGRIRCCEIVVSEVLLWGDFSLFMNGSPLVKDVDYMQTDNGTHYTFYIPYILNTHIIEIIGTHAIPEFSPFTILSLCMIAMLAVVLYEKKTFVCMLTEVMNKSFQMFG